MTYRARKRLALFILLVGMPVYVVAAATLVGWMDRPPIWAELLVYATLGIAWILPLRRVFLGVAQADPQQSAPDQSAPDQSDKGPQGPQE